MRVTLFTLLAVQSALAFPLNNKRQAATTTEIVSSITSVATVVASATSQAAAEVTSAISEVASEVLSATEVASSAIESAQSEALPSESASASAEASFYPGYFAFPCPEGSELTYVESQMNVNQPLAEVQAAVANFGNSSLFEISNVTGEDNTEGQTRTVMIQSAMADELLYNYTVNAETQAIYANWNSTAPVTIDGLTVASYSTEQQTYINDTETTDAQPVSTIKLFSNICASSADEAQTFFSNFFMQAIQNGTMAAQEGSAESSGLSTAVVVAPTQVISSVSEILDSATQSASEALSSATSAVESAASSITAAPASVASSVAGQVSSQVSSQIASATGGATGSGGPLQVNSPPALVQCQPAAIVFNGGSGPYFLSVLPGGQPTATPLLQFAQQSVEGQYVWVVNVAAGTSVTLQVRDGTGNINFSSPITIQQGPDSSCLAAAPSA